MKALLASLVVASAAAAVWSAPAAAESSYWDSRYRDARDRSYDRYEDRGYEGRRAYRGKAYRRDDGVAVEIRKRRPSAPLYVYRGAKPRSYNGPVYQSQEQVQQSVYDFATGGPGDINAYR